MASPSTPSAFPPPLRERSRGALSRDGRRPPPPLMCRAFIPASRCKDTADDRRMLALPDGCPARHTVAAATNKAGRKRHPARDIFLSNGLPLRFCKNQFTALKEMVAGGTRRALLFVLTTFLKCTLCLGGDLGGSRSFLAASKTASPCLNVTEDGCLAVSGCAWCAASDTWNGAIEGVEACMDWSLCKGPPGSCYARHDEASCTAVDGLLSAGSKIGIIGAQWHGEEGHGEEEEVRDIGGVVVRRQQGDAVAGGLRASSPACAWCKIEQRCVEDVTSSKQCQGCDGVFDSGMRFDVCGNCGGGCIDSFVDSRNPFCGCLGCDNVLHSNLTYDVCGVCGGTNSTCFPFQSLTKQERTGIALALCGNVLISVSLNTQKYAHNLNEVDSGGARSYFELPMWWLGMTLMTLGETGNFLAYAYAPATLVAPLGAITVISNCILAHYVLKEEINKRNVLGVVLAIVGAVFIVTYAPGSDEQLTMDLLEKYMMEKTFIAYMFCLVACITSLFATKDTHKKRYVVIYVLICSMTGSITVMCVKGVSTALILTFEGHNQFIYFVPWMLLVTTVGTIVVQMKYLNLAMINFGASEVVPVYYVMFTFWSILGGMVLYKEYHQNCPEGQPDCHYTLWFLVGCAITFSGVYLITFSKDSGASPSMQGALLSETERLLGGSDDESERGDGDKDEYEDEEAGSGRANPRMQSMQPVIGSSHHSASGSASSGSGVYLPSEL